MYHSTKQLADALRAAIPHIANDGARKIAVTALAAHDAPPKNPRCQHCGEHRFDIIGVDYWDDGVCPCIAGRVPS